MTDAASLTTMLRILCNSVSSTGLANPRELVERAVARIEACEAALRPFAIEADVWADTSAGQWLDKEKIVEGFPGLASESLVSVGDLRLAKAVYHAKA